MVWNIRLVALFLIYVTEFTYACFNYTDSRNGQVSCISCPLKVSLIFEEARNYCQTLQPTSNLAKIDHDNKRLFIVGVNELSQDAYIGLSYSSVSNAWSWTDGTALNDSTAMWQDKEPTDPTSKGCVRLNGGDQTWETKDCSNKESILCEYFYPESPIDGQWSTWTSWSSCSVTCRDGIQSRSRTCTNPAPQHGGITCSGPTQENAQCEMHHECPYIMKKYSQAGGVDKYLNLHTLKSFTAQSAIECASQCSQTIGCESYNYMQHFTEGQHSCELKTSTHIDNPVDFESKTGSRYYV